MPNYEVEYSFPMTDDQQHALADAITKIHSELFTAPSLFVNVRFTNVTGHALYIAGKRRVKNPNRIFALVRYGPMRPRSDFDILCQRINQAWDRIIVGPLGSSKADYELRTVFVQGAITAAVEAGFVVPEPGKDKEWIQENMGKFREKADAGDEEFVGLVEEVERRADLKT